MRKTTRHITTELLKTSDTEGTAQPVGKDTLWTEKHMRLTADFPLDTESGNSGANLSTQNPPVKRPFRNEDKRSSDKSGPAPSESFRRALGSGQRQTEPQVCLEWGPGRFLGCDQARSRPEGETVSLVLAGCTHRLTHSTHSTLFDKDSFYSFHNKQT